MKIPGDVAEVSCMGTFIRKDWLDNLGMQEPKTMDEYVEYLLACVTMIRIRMESRILMDLAETAEIGNILRLSFMPIKQIFSIL